MKHLHLIVTYSLVFVVASLSTYIVADKLGMFDQHVPVIRETTRVIDYPGDGGSVKIICVTQGSRRDKNGAIVPLPIDTGVPQVGDLYVNTCRGVAK